MNRHALKDTVLSWLDNRLGLPDDSPETKALKIRFSLYLINGIPFLAFTGLIFWISGLKHVSIAMWFFTFFELMLCVGFIVVRKYINTFTLINQVFYVLFSFAAVLYFGGIMYSGGLVLVGLAGVLNSLYLLKPAQIRMLFIGYIVTVIVEAMLQPYLKQIPEITPTANLILFVLHLLVIMVVFHNWLNFFIKQNMLLKTKEVEHLKEVDKVKTDFYTRITHEFRTPLTIILGYTSSTIKMSQSDLKQTFPAIHKNGIRLMQLVDKMLSLSRLESKAMQLNFIQSDILSYIRQLVETIQYLAKEKNIKLHFQSHLQKLNMDFDPDKIDSLLSNLISNSIKYSPENTDVYIRAFRFSAKGKQDFGYSVFPEKRIDNDAILGLTVKDSGFGINENEISLIFNRFSQGKHNNDYQTHGAGIGLFIVKELVQLLNGNLFISSTPGNGTEITVLLPITNKVEISQTKKVEENPAPNITMKNESSNNESGVKKELPVLLIVEDNDDIVSYLHTILRKYYRIIRAENGIQGIEMSVKEIPDIIISDVLMPGKNGFEVCETLKNDFRTSHIPIIILSAKGDKPSQIKGYKKGADAYISKPFDQQELLVRLQKLIEIRDKLKHKYKALALLPDAPVEDTESADEKFLIEIKKITSKFFQNDNFDSTELSGQVGMSRSQLFRKLKALTGLSATQFIRFYRLSVAKKMIHETDLNISEIAYEVGFKDPAYFTRVFTDQFGAPPSSWRNQGNKHLSNPLQQ